jgi:hypothetical protein
MGWATFWANFSQTHLVTLLLAFVAAFLSRVARWYLCFGTKITNLGLFWRALEWKMLVNFMTILNILQLFGIFCGQSLHLVVT